MNTSTSGNLSEGTSGKGISQSALFILPIISSIIPRVVNDTILMDMRTVTAEDAALAARELGELEELEVPEQ